MKRLFVILFVITGFSVDEQPSSGDAAKFRQLVFSLTKVMYHDVVNPPAAARFYAYCMLASYEVQCQFRNEMPGFHRQFKGYVPLTQTADPQLADESLTILYALMETAKNILPSGYRLAEEQQGLLNEFRKRSGTEKIDSSIAFAKRVSANIIKYAKTDGYFKLSTLPRYSLKKEIGSWRPTPPEYMAAVEPNWKTIRTFFLDSARQFTSVPAVEFDTLKGSSFHGLVTEVYSTVKNLSEEQKLIANYWDCNPFAVQFAGHMSVGLKKISPGGHWMSIAGIAGSKAGLDLSGTVLLYAILACTLHDAFVVCWDEKFRSNRIRPETAINKMIDEKWKPFLQTPPFPEYTSGHSVISTATAALLEHFLGNNFSFTDTTETYIGLPERNFSSFSQAADEACISRLYGGIHFRDAIENGREQGKRIAAFIISKFPEGLGIPTPSAR